MKRILLAAGLIALSQAASAGPISDALDACDAKALAFAQTCINRATTQGEETLCKISGKMTVRACLKAANDAAPLNPYDEY